MQCDAVEGVDANDDARLPSGQESIACARIVNTNESVRRVSRGNSTWTACRHNQELHASRAMVVGALEFKYLASAMLSGLTSTRM